MAMKLIPTYSDGNGNTVTFLELGVGFPGFTHRVIINRVPVSLLASSHRPNAKAAEFFLQEHAHKARAA